MSEVRTRDSIEFAERCLALLDEGRFTATYKFAVLLALMDVCLEHTTKDGTAPGEVSVEDLAERVVQLYWPQTSVFADADIAVVLRQNTKSQAEIVSLIRRFRERSSADASAPLAQARSAAPAAYSRLMRAVERLLIEMPLPRLQVFGQGEERFIYEYNFGGARSRMISLVGNAGDHLVQLSGLLRPLIQRRWSDMVRQINSAALDDPDLDGFLFGVDRISLDPVRAPLRELQDNRCFYCDGRMQKADIDHFLPWARHPDNGIHNLVAAHPECNNAKRAFLAGLEHVRRWLRHFDPELSLRGQLDGIAVAAGWGRDAQRTLSVGRGLYLSLRPTAKLWRETNVFEDAEPAALRKLLVA